MISAEEYYRLNIENKSEKEIKTQVKLLQKQIKKLEKLVSKNKSNTEEIDPKLNLLYLRQYLGIIKHGIEIDESCNIKEKLSKALELVKNEQAYKVVRPKPQNDNVRIMDGYSYANEITDIIKFIGVDYSYTSNYDLIKDKKISELTKEELKTHITRIFRGERFCTGFIAGSIDAGIMEKIIKRYIDLC